MYIYKLIRFDKGRLLCLIEKVELTSIRWRTNYFSR